MPRTSVSKPSRLNIRVSEHEKDVITRAASTLNTSVSSFVVQRAYDEAQVILAEQNQFRLPDKKWREFCRALDAPPKAIPALHRLGDSATSNETAPCDDSREAGVRLE